MRKKFYKGRWETMFCWNSRPNKRRKALCSWFMTLDSFAMFKNKLGVQWCMNNVAYEVPQYKLKATLLEDRFNIEYDAGAYSIPIEKQPCRYGGFRYFFHCPNQNCKKRMRLLYCHKGVFLCRQCLKLGYFTQRLKPKDSCFIMQSKIEKYLKNRAGSLNAKPPWMKQYTFETIKKRHHFYEKKYDKIIYRQLCKKYGRDRAHKMVYSF